jgi:predicted HTH domain antitoxin
VGGCLDLHLVFIHVVEVQNLEPTLCHVMPEFAFAFKDLNMSTQITIDLPDDAFSALRSRPEDFVKEMRLAAAVKWLELGLVSQSKAAELAGVSRESFMQALTRLRVSPFQETPEELCEAVNRA